ncbi:MAG: Dabb family protein [Bacteroidota bacterium]
MKRSVLLLLPLLLLACGQPTKSDEMVEEIILEEPVDMSSSPDSLLRHAVLFSFNEDSYPEGVKEVEDAFRALPEKIPAIHSFEWGTNNSPEGLDKGYTHLFFVTFKSEADREVYLPHPDHKAVGEVLKPHRKEVLVLDYWTPH